MVVREPVEIEVSLSDTHFIRENGNLVIFLEKYDIEYLLRVEINECRVPGYQYNIDSKRLTIFSDRIAHNLKLIKLKINCYSTAEERDIKLNKILN